MQAIADYACGEVHSEEVGDAAGCGWDPFGISQRL